VLGEGGVIPLEPAFLRAAAELAAEHGALLAFDEVQTGVGRTGTFFAWEQAGVRPDLVTLAKGLANGLPLGCLLVSEEAAGAFGPGDHASTFGGNPVACAAACAVCDAIDDDLLARVRQRGEELRAGLGVLGAVRETRGRGLLVGAELDRPAAPVVADCLDQGLLVTSAGERVLRLTPPLTIEPADIREALDILREVLA
jgi:acetylornithine/succinyldiaminopimelate/putrescine aminotransferase